MLTSTVSLARVMPVSIKQPSVTFLKSSSRNNISPYLVLKYSNFRVLIENGADVNVQDEELLTPLMVAAR